MSVAPAPARDPVEDRNYWIQLFNRLERHVSRHAEKKEALGEAFCDDVDDELHRGWRQVMRDAQG